MTTPDSTPAGRPPTRRGFLRVAIPAALAAAGLAAWADGADVGRRLRRARARARDSLRVYRERGLRPADRILRHYAYLQLDGPGVERYAREYERVYGRVNPRSRASLANFHTRYLMSTDFFVNGGDESKPVRYVALYHPHTSPCWNPFPPARA